MMEMLDGDLRTGRMGRSWTSPAVGGGGQPQRRPGRPWPLPQFRLARHQFLDVAPGGPDEPGLLIARPYVAGQPSAQPQTRAQPARRARWLLAHDAPPRGAANDRAAGVCGQAAPQSSHPVPTMRLITADGIIPHG